MLVDDEQSLLDTSRERIERSLPGVQVLSYSTGPLALSETKGVNLGLAVLDVDMPAMSGLELARALRARAADLPILFLTGTAQQDMEKECELLGGAVCLRKPISGEALVSAIEDLVLRDE